MGENHSGSIDCYKLAMNPILPPPPLPSPPLPPPPLLPLPLLLTSSFKKESVSSFAFFLYTYRFSTACVDSNSCRILWDSLRFTGILGDSRGLEILWWCFQRLEILEDQFWKI